MEITKPEKITVTVDSDLKDLVAGYLDNRRLDIETIKTSMEEGDFETIKFIGHSMKGSGGGYGFDRITELGAALERSAKGQDTAVLNTLTLKLSDYLGRLEIVFG